jgi:hypothetical protein
VNTQPEDDRTARIRQARQVLAGSDVQPPHDPLTFGNRSELISPEQIVYLAGLAVLLVVAVLLYAIWGMGIASVVFMLLALALLAGWVIF